MSITDRTQQIFNQWKNTHDKMVKTRSSLSKNDRHPYGFFIDLMLNNMRIMAQHIDNTMAIMHIVRDTSNGMKPNAIMRRVIKDLGGDKLSDWCSPPENVVQMPMSRDGFQAFPVENSDYVEFVLDNENTQQLLLATFTRMMALTNAIEDIMTKAADDQVDLRDNTQSRQLLEKLENALKENIVYEEVVATDPSA